MIYSALRCKIIVDREDKEKCYRFFKENLCNPILVAEDDNHALFVATMTPEERLIFKLKIKNPCISDYRFSESDRLTRQIHI